MIIGKSDLETFVDEGILQIYGTDGRPKFSAFSLDLRVGGLYQHNNHWHELSKKDRVPSRGTASEDMPTEEYVDAFLDEIELSSKGRIIDPGNYVWRPLEEISLHGHCFSQSKDNTQKVLLGAEIVSRSSWARRGVRVQQAENDLISPGVSYSGRPLCGFITQTRVVLQEHDAIGQIVLTSYEDYPTVPENEIRYLIDNNKMVIRRDGAKLSCKDLEFQDDGIVLSMDNIIKPYIGGIIDPSDPSENMFKQVDIDGGYYVQPGTFFISSSAEYVEIPDGYVGYVTESNFHRIKEKNSIPKIGPDDSILPYGFHAHTNAPYIGPRGIFQGTITFENTVWNLPIELHPRRPQSILQLKRLSCLVGDSEKSRFLGQQGPRIS
jgi:deoxycytidine triphosphate deaminase